MIDTHKPVTKSISRNQNLHQFLESLQIEYIIAELRSKIYSKDSDKLFWNKVKEFKRLKISKISSANLLANIFNDSSILKIIEARVYVGLSYPNFFYNTKDHGVDRTKLLDLINYYKEGSEISFFHNNNTQTGYIHYYIVGEPTVTIKPRKDTSVLIQLPLSNITRIL